MAWLLLPQERAVEIWRGGQQGMAQRLVNASRVDGSELAEGLGLDLEEIWAV
jgi:Uma2 family endonuclease